MLKINGSRIKFGLLIKYSYPNFETVLGSIKRYGTEV